MKKFLCFTIILCIFILTLRAPVYAQGLPKKDFYNHPLRIAAYIGYPIGLVIDTFIFRPIFYIIQTEPADKLFGIQPEEKL